MAFLLLHNYTDFIVSIGKTFARNSRYHELDELLVEADSNMYSQKKSKKIQSK